MIDLIEIHSEDERLMYCDHCDSDSELTSIWYIPSEAYGLRPHYLSCCVDKIGKVVDWDIKRSTKYYPPK